MTGLPTGLVTLLFTDVEGSTRLLAALGEMYVSVLADHRRILRSVAAEAGGSEVDTQGDAFLFVFPSADSAVAAAVAIQLGLSRHPWPEGVSLRVRVGVHTGRPVRTDEGYVGLDLHKGARIAAAGHGGQVVVSAQSRDGMAGRLTGVRFRPLGAHRLKDLDQPLTLYDLVIDGLDSEFPPLRSLGSHPTNLPRDLAPLVGRGDDEVAVLALLQQADRRLVTLTGPGGTGKTSLALRAASRALADLADGVFVVWLAGVQQARAVPEAIAAALGLRGQAGRDMADVVQDYLAQREMLVLLDNFEHVVDAASLVGDLLQAAPRLRILVTSRIALRVSGEVEFPVQPLPVEHGSASGSADDELPAATQLFLVRARSARRELSLDSSTLCAVAEICARLDGLPLAIELAAARVRLMSPQAMLARLTRPLELASGGSRTAESRHQALRTTISWSVELLTERQRLLFAHLGVFAGPFEIEAAEQVCHATLDGLAELLDHSLLRSVDDTGRLSMLETVRAYARERLQAGDDEVSVRDRHAAWCAQLASAGNPELLSGAHENLLPRFDAEQNDLRAALEWLLTRGRNLAALQLTNDLAVFWDTRGQWTEGRARIEQALAAAVDPPATERARAQFYLGRFAANQGDGAGARAALEQALAVFRAQHDARSVTLCLSHLAVAVAAGPGGREEAARLNEQALAVARASGDPWTIAVALNNLAIDLGDDERPRATALLEEGLEIRRTLGEKRTLAITLGNYGELLVDQGRVEQARLVLTEALTLAVELGMEAIIAEARRQLGLIAEMDGDLDRAMSMIEDAWERAGRLGDPTMQALCRTDLDRIAALARGESVADRSTSGAR